MIRTVGRFVAVLSRWMDQASCAFVLLAAGLTVFNVVARGLFNRPVSAIYDYVGFITTVVIALSLAQCALDDGHVALTLVVDMLPAGAKRAAQAATDAVGFCFLLVTGCYVLKRAGEAYVNRELTMSARLPYYPFVAVVGIGLVVLSLALLCRAVRACQPDRQ